ncbi:hypothetical protein ACS0TY_036833 [Phlomoides rotata]
MNCLFKNPQKEKSKIMQAKLTVPSSREQEGPCGIPFQILLLRWSPHPESHSSGRKTGESQSTSSGSWFSGHETEEHEEATEEKGGRSVRQGLSSSHQEEKITHSQIGESSSSSTSRGHLKHVGINAPSSPVIQGSGSPQVSISLPTGGETSGDTSSPAIVDSSIPLPGLRLRRSPAVQEVSEAGEADTFDNGMTEQVIAGSVEQIESVVYERKVKQRRLQRKDQVVRDRFNEWEEAYRLEAEQRKIDEMFMREALLEAQKATDKWEVPVGSMLMRNGKIIACGWKSYVTLLPMQKLCAYGKLQTCSEHGGFQFTSAVLRGKGWEFPLPPFGQGIQSNPLTVRTVDSRQIEKVLLDIAAEAHHWFLWVCETELGIVSQCCQPRQSSKYSKQCMENVSLKFNVFIPVHSSLTISVFSSISILLGLVKNRVAPSVGPNHGPVLNRDLRRELPSQSRQKAIMMGELSDRKDQVVRDRFNEWEEAYRLEAEQRKIDEMFMREALLEAQKATDKWEVPVGSMLMRNGKIIACGWKSYVTLLPMQKLCAYGKLQTCSEHGGFQFTSAVLRGKGWEFPLPPFGQGCFRSLMVESRVAPSVGQWNMIDKKMINGGKVDYWACITFSRIIDVDSIQSNPLTVRTVDSRQIEKVLLDIAAEAHHWFLWVCETELGIVSQCCQPRQSSKYSKQCMENVSLKFNVFIPVHSSLTISVFSSISILLGLVKNRVAPSVGPNHGPVLNRDLRRELPSQSRQKAIMMGELSDRDGIFFGKMLILAWLSDRVSNTISKFKIKKICVIEVFSDNIKYCYLICASFCFSATSFWVLWESSLPLPCRRNDKNRQPIQTFRPYNIAHHGSNGEIPEETTAAYMRAIEEGADFIEMDILASKDGVLICFHDVTLDETTDIADHKEFSNRKRTYEVQGDNATGFFTVDFTLKELKSLRVRQRYDFRDQQYNGQYQNFIASLMN